MDFVTFSVLIFVELFATSNNRDAKLNSVAEIFLRIQNAHNNFDQAFAIRKKLFLVNSIRK